MANKQELIQQLSDKYNIPESEIDKAVDSQFKFVARAMAEDHMPSIRLPYFGIFKANRKRAEILTKKKQLKNDNKKKQERETDNGE